MVLDCTEVITRSKAKAGEYEETNMAMAFRHPTYITDTLNCLNLIQTDTSILFTALKYLDANVPNSGALGPEQCK